MNVPSDLPRIAIVGPVAPFRGGIAQHTTRLAEALARIAAVDVVSFSRLYPALLYPGAFQTEGTTIGLPGNRITFALDSVNPLTWRTALRHLDDVRPERVVIPWWTFFLAPCFEYLGRRLRARRVPIVFVCHNVVDHEAAAWKQLLSRRVLRAGDRFLVHATEEQRKLRALLGPVDVAYSPQPLFDSFPAAQGTLARRGSTELLFFGFIRPYKGLDTLLQALTLLPDLDIHVSIVGEPWRDGEAVWKERIASAGLGRRVELVARYVTHAAAAEFFHRADAVVLPYTSATGTAVISLAYHYRKPVIASRVGNTPDVVEHGRTGLLFPPGDAEALAAAIRRFAAERLPDAGPAIDRLADLMTWERLAAAVLTTSVASAGAPRGSLSATGDEER